MIRRQSAMQRDTGDQQRGITKDSRGAVRKAMNLLVYKNRSERELRSRLTEGGFSEEAIEEAVAYVSSFGYLNDRRYAESYAASYAGKKSRMVIRAGLREKGIDERYIEEALESLPEDEKDAALELLQKKAGTPHMLRDQELRRVTGFLARRGFSSHDIWQAVREYQSGTDDEC